MEACRGFLSEVLSLYELLQSPGKEGDGIGLARMASLDLAPLSDALAGIDREGPDSLSALEPGDLILLAHRLEAIMGVLAPFAREDGPLASRIRALAGEGPLSAYRKASRESSVLFGHNVIGRL